MSESLSTNNLNQAFTGFDQKMMAQALQIAQQAEFTARPNPMVGCVITQNNEIIAQGWHQKSGLAHAEINALNAAMLSVKSVKGATCYVTLEPCAHTGKTGPCAQALIDAGVGKVVAAMRDPNPQVAGKGFAMLKAAGISVEWGLLEAQARQLNAGFVKRFEQNRPKVTCKLAMSLDGRTAMADGTSQWITGAAARNDVQKLRAKQDGIITGIGTVLSDDPSLNVRGDQDWFAQAQQLGFTQPNRILLDRQQQADLTAKIFNNDALVYWYSEKAKPSGKAKSTGKTGPSQKAKNFSHLVTRQQPQNLKTLLQQLADDGMNNVLIEAGHKLAGAFLEQGLIDELVVYVAPKLMGNQAMGLVDLSLSQMQDSVELELVDLRQVGDDLRLTYRPKT
jgi:diaminohydroxyphosphoribosylaminopyrimidine deaminase / 5-amino-6-(5-phosphoribosylamino)uracil reductase